MLSVGRVQVEVRPLASCEPEGRADRHDLDVLPERHPSVGSDDLLQRQPPQPLVVPGHEEDRADSRLPDQLDELACVLLKRGHGGLGDVRLEDDDVRLTGVDPVEHLVTMPVGLQGGAALDAGLHRDPAVLAVEGRGERLPEAAVPEGEAVAHHEDAARRRDVPPVRGANSGVLRCCLARRARNRSIVGERGRATGGEGGHRGQGSRPHQRAEARDRC
ncbi:MAG: hypothetical protein ACPGPE_10650 [Planctomycetota bacterium]